MSLWRRRVLNGFEHVALFAPAAQSYYHVFCTVSIDSFSGVAISSFSPCRAVSIFSFPTHLFRRPCFHRLFLYVRPPPPGIRCGKNRRLRVGRIGDLPQIAAKTARASHCVAYLSGFGCGGQGKTDRLSQDGRLPVFLFCLSVYLLWKRPVKARALPGGRSGGPGCGARTDTARAVPRPISSAARPAGIPPAFCPSRS